MTKYGKCADCAHGFFLAGAGNDPGLLSIEYQRWCRAPQLAEVMDDRQGHKNAWARCNETRDFKFACGHTAAWFTPRKAS